MEIFEKASKTKLRFATSKGLVSTEDLWDFSLTALDTVAKAVNRELKNESEESFISAKTSSNTALELRLDILKHIIAYKLAEKDAAAVRAEKQAKLAQLKELATNKANEQLSAKSLEDIQKMIAELEA
jgi:hypothetical protein